MSNDPREYFDDETLALMNKAVDGLVSNINTSTFASAKSNPYKDLLELQDSDIAMMGYETLGSHISKCREEISYCYESARYTRSEIIITTRYNRMEKLEIILKKLEDARDKTPEAMAEHKVIAERNRHYVGYEERRRKEEVAAVARQEQLSKIGALLIVCATGAYLYFLWGTGIPRAVWFSAMSSLFTRQADTQAMLYAQASSFMGLYRNTFTGLILPLGVLPLIFLTICMFCRRAYVFNLCIIIVVCMYFVQLFTSIGWEGQFRSSGRTTTNILNAVIIYLFVLFPGLCLLVWQKTKRSIE